MAHTRRLLVRLTQATFALALVSTVGCWEDPSTYAGSGSAGARAGNTGGGTGGSGGTGGDGSGGTGGDDTGGSGGTASGGSMGGTGDGPGTAGSAAGSGGSIGGSAAAGTGGSIGGSAAGSGGNGTAGGGGQVARQAWPSSDAVVAVDVMGMFPENLSDLAYQPAAGGEASVLWAIQNDPPVLYCLLWNGTTWTAMTDDNWGYGKMLRYPGGTGSPDAEGMTRAEWSSTAIYVASERDNAAGSISRMSVLRFDFAASGTTLTATHEWNLTADLPTAAANVGIESVTWVPDSYLVANGLFDEAANAAYNPSRYPGHGTGLFLVGLESNGMIYGYALNHDDGTFARIATISSGLTAVMGLAFDRDQGNLWAHCDNGCANEAAVLRVSAGRLALNHLYDRPATLPNSNQEGITIAPESECVSGRKSFYWSDDDDFGGHAIYRGSIPCGTLP